jgi:hypothetical protein
MICWKNNPRQKPLFPNEELSPAGELALNSDDLDGVPGEAYAPVRKAVGTDLEEYATTGRRNAPPPSQLERKPGVVGRVKIKVEETLPEAAHSRWAAGDIERYG